MKFKAKNNVSVSLAFDTETAYTGLMIISNKYHLIAYHFCIYYLIKLLLEINIGCC